MMWARVVECMLGCWMAISPLLFQHGDQHWLWAIDFTTSLTIIVLALVSYWPPMRHAHLGLLGVALAMILFGRLAGGWDPAPGLQNHIVIGLLLAMFALVPNNASQPPDSWYPQFRDGNAGI